MSAKYCYQFQFDDGKTLEYEVETTRSRGQEPVDTETMESWVELGYCQCTNCPLDKKTHQYCPAALDIQKVVNDFGAQPAFQKVNVKVVGSERAYVKRTSLEEGVRSLLGLIMATSDCPILSELKPMAIHHLPFSTGNEFILRSVSMYLLNEYFKGKEGRVPDWNLEGLVERNKRLQLVNQALWQRIHSACASDSNLKALLNFFSMSSSVSFSLDSQLHKLKKHLETGEDG